MGTGQSQKNSPVGLRPRYSQDDTSSSADVDSGSPVELDLNAVRPRSSILASPACSTCLTTGTTCTLSTDHDDCVLCRRTGHECSLNPANSQSRKRKLHGDAATADGTFKRGGSTAPDAQPDAPTPLDSASMVESMANCGGPTLLKRTLGLQVDRYPQYIGATTDLEHALINLSLFDARDESPLPGATLRKVHPKHTFMLMEEKDHPNYPAMSQDLDDIEAVVAPYGRELVDLYFQMVHPPLPVVPRHVFMESYEKSYRELSPCLLAAVYLIALTWWDRHPALVDKPRPNIRALERLAISTYNDAAARPKLCTIQAGLILSQRPGGESWAMTAQLVALAQDLGLHLECGAWKIPPWERGLRKRIAWALYMQDKWSAITHGRPSHIHSANWAVRWLSPYDWDDVEWNEDDVEERADIEKGRLIFSRSALLSGILAEMLETFFSAQAMQAVENAGAQGAHLVLSLAKPIQLKLKDWYSNLPEFIRLESLSSGGLSDRPSSVGYLHVAYYAAEITLHRRIIACLAANAGSVDTYIQDVCRSAAKTRLISAMDFVNRLSPNHLKSFWYFSSKANFALIGTFGSLLWATSPGREEAEWYKRRLSEYRWTLSVSSQSVGENSPTVQALAILDLSTELLKQLPEKPSTSRSGSYANLARSRARSNFAARASILGGYSQVSSPRIRAVRQPKMEDYSSGGDEDDEMYDDPVRR